MDTRKLNAVGAFATLLALATSTLPGFLLEGAVDGWLEGGSALSLPLLGSVGQTVLIYSYAVGALEQFFPLAIGVWVGVWLTRRFSATELPESLRAVAVGSAAVVAAAAIPLAIVWGGFSLSDLGMLFGLLAELTVRGPLLVIVAAAGGITLSKLGFLGGNGPNPAPFEASENQNASTGETDDEPSLSQVP